MLRSSRLEQLLLPAQISERSDVCKIQRDAKLVFSPDHSERKAPVLERNSAAGSVIAYFDEFVLQGILLDVIAKTRFRVPAASVRRAISHLGPNLIRGRLQHGAKRRQDRRIIDGKLRHGKIEIFSRANFQ